MNNNAMYLRRFGWQIVVVPIHSALCAAKSSDASFSWNLGAFKVK
jgi:hypothetical protein